MIGTCFWIVHVCTRDWGKVGPLEIYAKNIQKFWKQ